MEGVNSFIYLLMFCFSVNQFLFQSYVFIFLLNQISSSLYLSFVVFSCFSKSGRPPLKKLSDRKAFACPGHISTNGSPDFAGTVPVFHSLVCLD